MLVTLVGTLLFGFLGILVGGIYLNLAEACGIIGAIAGAAFGIASELDAIKQKLDALIRLQQEAAKKE